MLQKVARTFIPLGKKKGGFKTRPYNLLDNPLLKRVQLAIMGTDVEYAVSNRG
jgi:hypothetical protein